MISSRLTLAAIPLVLAVAAGLVAFATPESFEPVETMVDDGNWFGTWMYVNRDGRMVLWVREGEDGRPEVRVRFRSTAGPEAFETDWDGRATYILAGEPATFHMEITSFDAATLEGNWLWDVQFSRAGRSERGQFVMYRTFDGRMAIQQFVEYEKVVRKGEKVMRYDGNASWGFRKVSKRVVLWDEVF